MFIALDSTGRRRFSFEKDKLDLRKLSRSKNLFCPYCDRLVFFHGGEKRIHHFNHEPHVECTFTGEPETQEHLNGKLLIYEWLKKQYPQAEVFLEKRITETNQIADVYAAFPDGQKFAFEIQCSELSVEEWKRRRKLYREANVRDFWFFGKRYYREVLDEPNLNKKKLLRLNFLLQVVNKKNRSVYFIDSQRRTITQIGDFFEQSSCSDTIFFSNIQVIPIEGMKVIKVQSPCRYVLADQNTIKNINMYFVKRSNAARWQWKNWIYNKQRIKERYRDFERYQKYLENFSLEDAIRKMSFREEIIFRQLVREYNLTDQNFPGIFNIQLENHHYIHTPYPLWQLLVFHKAIKHNTSNKKLIFPPYFFQDIKTKVRYEVKNSKYVAGLIYEYLEALESCGFITNHFSAPEYKHPFEIKNNLLSKMENKRENSLLAMYFSEFNIEENEMDGEPVDFVSDEMRKEAEKVKNYYRYLVINHIE